jgi:DNA-binding transcriptional LysR family regulator
VDLDLRKLRYFCVLAEHLNFGRAAQALHIAQPVLSRQIRAFENELAVALFVRDRRTVELTPAGAQMLADAAPLLASAAALTRRTRIAARERISFTVGFMPGLMVTEAVQALELAHPGLSVSVLRTGWDDQADVVHDGRADVSYVRQPVSSRGLQVMDLFTEPRVVVLAAAHRLSGKESVSITDLVDEHLLQNPDAVPEWRDISTDILHKRPRDDRVSSYSVEEKLENVARGKGIAVLPESVVTFYHRPDIVTAPITDIGPNHIGLAWDATRHSNLIREFAALASRHQPF